MKHLTNIALMLLITYLAFSFINNELIWNTNCEIKLRIIYIIVCVFELLYYAVVKLIK